MRRKVDHHGLQAHSERQVRQALCPERQAWPVSSTQAGQEPGSEGVIMGAKKTGGTAGRRRAADSAAAAFMAKMGVKRTTYRDPITYQMRPIGSYPGGKMKG